MLLPTNLLDTTSLLNILLAWCLVFGIEVLAGVSDQEVGDLRKFLTEAVDRLQIHIGLGNQLWERDCIMLGLKGRRKGR